ncbi:ThiF family adenylyltransferase [Gloeobacter kilaueensis]|uniref:Thiamine biosynthesis protein ThiF n=1 Tax=Gloeobacter kilaueensis (strain ATCC BAA-2537 / CCAP 1431/1 / ULC 316 / JS1) TaxID=1183438 RepID=U5QGF0_GLOK1|nr:ThiF family adenylyltransferase [Gloeobacter kilaueensis]AGY57996.1 thiamine biosynthesis protein ThiF [Gloeobacter kilaueensis JS1]
MVDLSYARAVPLLTLKARQTTIVQVGAGGTGGWLYPHLVRLLRVLLDRGESVRLLLCDPDIVEESNLIRQNFCAAELGMNKAEALAFRYQAAWGLELPALNVPFSRKILGDNFQYAHDHFFVIVGCVDNAAARLTIHQLLLNIATRSNVSNILWIDAGNHVDTGQVLVGNIAEPDLLAHSFDTPGHSHCALLPSPALQHPELLVPQLEENPDADLSCEELLRLKTQSLTINLAMASLAADYLLHLLVTRNLRRFASYLDIPSGARRNRYNTPEHLAAAVGLSPDSLFSAAGAAIE